MKTNFLIAALMTVGLGACATSGYDRGSSYDSSSSYRSRDCYDCGVVQRIESYTGEPRRTTGAGAVAGALIGGAIGNQVGSGDGKKAATVAGAVAGGIAGNAIEKNTDRTWYDITVRMGDGRTVVVTQNDLNGVGEGSNVVVRDGRVRLN